MSYGPKRSKRSSKKFAHFLSLQVSDCICITIKQAKKKIQPKKKGGYGRTDIFVFIMEFTRKKAAEKQSMNLKQSPRREKRAREKLTYLWISSWL